MKACGLVGSPIKGGNVDLLVDRVLEGVAARGGAAKKVRLNELEIHPCQSCGPSESRAFCRFDDDMREIYAALEESDIVVLGSPVYFDTVSAQTKLMIDRCNCLRRLIERDDGATQFKPRLAGRRVGVLVAVAGLEQDFASIRATAAGFFTWITADFMESVLYPHAGNKKGSVRGDATWMRKAFRAGVQAADRWLRLCGSPPSS